MGIRFLGDFILTYSDDPEEVEKMMSKHYLFFDKIQKEDQYVTKGSILWCSEGTELTRFNIQVDHGIVRKTGEPIGICSDCKENENIYSFGGCKSSLKHHPKRKTVIVDATSSRIYEMEKCIPMLEGDWKCEKRKNLKVWDYTDKCYQDIITTGDYLTCYYGGFIKVVEVPQISNINWTLSIPAGLNALKKHETNLSVLKGWGLGVFDENGVLQGIYPHYVFRKNPETKQWESDGGITFGFGHFVSQLEYQTDPSEKLLIDTYAKGAPLIPSNVSLNGVSQVVQNSDYMPMNEVENLLKKDIMQHEQELNKLIIEYGYPMTQTKFDALVDLRYHKYRLGKEIDELLCNKSMDKVKWKAAIDKLIGQNGDLQRAADVANLFNDGVYPQ